MQRSAAQCGGVFIFVCLLCQFGNCIVAHIFSLHAPRMIESMKTSGTGRFLAALFIGVIGGIFLHFRQMRWLSEGREAFLAAQGRRFDFIAAHNSTGLLVIVGLILAVMAYGLYELLAAGFSRVIPPNEVNG